MQPSELKLNRRTRQILQAVIGYYIMTGEPVGSRKICKHCNLGVSPATVRNIMADLEEMGFLGQPHISAGRIPTDQGYRFYVDHLAHWRELSSKETNMIASACSPSRDNPLEFFLDEFSCKLSAWSKCIGVVMEPDLTQAVFKKIEFISIKPGRVLVMLISQWGYVHQRIIEIEENYTQDKLDQMARRINHHLSGLSLYDVRKKLKNILQRQKDHYHRMLVKAAKLSQGVMEGHRKPRIYIQGQLNILRYPDFTDKKKLRTLLSALEEKEKIIRVLDKYIEESGVHIIIGSEMEDSHMENLSFITSSYSFAGKMGGMLGVIGPTRLEYSGIVPMVNFAAQTISKRLQEG